MSHIYFDIPIEPVPEGQSPVKHLKELGCVTVKLTPSVSVMVTTAAEAQELKTRFAAAEFYLTDEPVLPAADLDDTGGDITDALVPVCGICGTTDPVLDVVTNSRAAGWRECRDLHACGDRVIAAAKATFVEVAK